MIAPEGQEIVAPCLVRLGLTGRPDGEDHSFQVTYRLGPL